MLPNFSNAYLIRHCVLSLAAMHIPDLLSSWDARMITTVNEGKNDKAVGTREPRPLLPRSYLYSNISTRKESIAMHNQGSRVFPLFSESCCNPLSDPSCSLRSSVCIAWLKVFSEPYCPSSRRVTLEVSCQFILLVSFRWEKSQGKWLSPCYDPGPVQRWRSIWRNTWSVCVI